MGASAGQRATNWLAKTSYEARAMERHTRPARLDGHGRQERSTGAPSDASSPPGGGGRAERAGDPG